MKDNDVQNMIDRAGVRVTTSDGPMSGHSLMERIAPVSSKEIAKLGREHLALRKAARDALESLVCGDAATAMLILGRATNEG